MATTAKHLSFDLSRAYQQQSLAGKSILVTGAGDGIGKQAALSYARCGAKVILLGRTVKKLEATYDEILAQDANNGSSSQHAPQPSIVPLDHEGATQQHYQGLADTINGEYGQLDGLLLNASVLGTLCPFAEIKEKEFDQVMQINVKAQFMLVQALLPNLLRSSASSVIFTSSGVGRKGRAFWGTYSISKFATEGMMQVLADEYKNKHVRFNCINPGGTRTGMRAKAFPGEDPNALKTPADIMPSYVYLMADESIKENGSLFDCQVK